MDSLIPVLQRFIGADTALLAALRAIRAQQLPDAWLAAGALRNRLWDQLHGYAAAPLGELDLIYFDAKAGLDEAQAVARALRAELVADWDVVNQASVHRWFRTAQGESIAALRSCADAVARWPETPTCVAVRLEADDSLSVLAPHGLVDLFALHWRANPLAADPTAAWRRWQDKAIAQRWPGARFSGPAD
ncbi:nucleotidyltransferase family protein [Chitinimonas taiwanensis]|uniref:Nucleotidyltransferase n=1 Tax=Chitinimonas taiwanensis DSM 18899 TaxID=1121279 RepID=A0A1K2H4P8_9NEIS|nr:nucleotidyltransferase family protein [Chitinimonas taiwanensis]SFZ70913.1 hypothetical protein SAMN02745887_00347 [Chitinimonas taiwanensis DSM 18899]